MNDEGRRMHFRHVAACSAATAVAACAIAPIRRPRTRRRYECHRKHNRITELPFFTFSDNFHGSKVCLVPLKHSSTGEFFPDVDQQGVLADDHKRAVQSVGASRSKSKIRTLRDGHKGTNDTVVTLIEDSVIANFDEDTTDTVPVESLNNANASLTFTFLQSQRIFDHLEEEL